jgi:long-chain acyl-CoA synthetase
LNKPWLELSCRRSAEIDISRYGSINDVFDESCARFGERIAFINMDTRQLCRTGPGSDKVRLLVTAAELKPGDRIALMMPNILYSGGFVWRPAPVW